MQDNISLADFRDYVEKNILEGWKDGARLNIREVRKNNGLIYTGITIMEEEQFMAPTIYLEEVYELIKQGLPLEGALELLKRQYEIAELQMDNIDLQRAMDIMEYDNCKDRIIVQLVNYKKNREMFACCPHVKIYDLAVVFRCLLHQDDGAVSSTMITHDVLSMWSVSAEELLVKALENTRRIFPENISALSDFFKEEAENLRDDIPEVRGFMNSIYVATNEQMVNGASVLLYDNLLGEFAHRIDGNFFIIPSSVHELLFVPEDYMTDPENTRNFIKEANTSLVSKEEILSDTLYFYNKEEGRLTTAS